MLLEDVQHLSSYMIIMHEGLLVQPSYILNKVREMTKMMPYEFKYVSRDEEVYLTGTYDSNKAEWSAQDERLYDLYPIIHSPTKMFRIEHSDEAFEWSFSYMVAINKLEKNQPKVYKQLLKLESTLKKYCYSIHTMEPICVDSNSRIRYVYKEKY